MNIINDIKQTLKTGNNHSKLIYINLGFFILAIFANLVSFLLKSDNDFILKWFALPSDGMTYITKPWTIISYMFLHTDFLHLLFNLLMLYWFGNIFLKYLSDRQLLSVYLLGGIAGGLLFMLAFNVFPVFKDINQNAVVLGASASIMAVIVAIASLIPKQKVYLLFFGQVNLIYLAIAIVTLDIISIPINNAGGYISHLGGALLGFLFTYQYQKGKDITYKFSIFLDKVFELFMNKQKKKIKVKRNKKTKKKETNTTSESYRKKEKTKSQIEIDNILAKVAKSGYSSLSKEEKEILFKNSRK